MTWVIGSAGIMGNGMLMGDVQVTISYGNGREKYIDCLQKVYKVSNSISAAFAGDVELGLYLIQDLYKSLNGIPPNHSWIPDFFFYRHYQRRIRWIFRNLKPEYKNRNVQLMIIAISPVMGDTVGGGGLPLTHGYILRWPDFKIEKMTRNKFYSIGSGSEVELYKNELNRINEDQFNNMMQFEVNNPGGYARSMSYHLQQIVEDNMPVNGISKHFLVSVVFRGKVEIAGILCQKIMGNNVVGDDFPLLVQDWNSLKKLAKTKGISLANAQVFG